MNQPQFTTAREQQQQLLISGFVHLPGALPSDLLTRWRTLAERLEHEASEAFAKGEAPHGACIVEDPMGPRLTRVDDILAVDADATLDLLASPAMLAVAREFCGRHTVPLQIDILYKWQHPHPVILWHQGAPHPRGYPYLNVGIHLDDADADDGCLRYVPGTQHELQDICAISENYGWEPPGVIEQPTKAGDILVQDMMILHGSPPKRSPGVRRTIYVELRPTGGIIESDEQSVEWMDLRKNWMGLVLGRAAPRDWSAEWREDYPAGLRSEREEIPPILALREAPIPSRYCNRPIETDGYPVPADMRSS